ncbi:MAG: helix-turn-helix transcriptional regulator, partial [Agathobacter sp.]|nr:helix-turn-helix transcriptional regulator [Agathobacter sp.]
MLNQEKTGKFMAEMRRQQNLTQKQLAEQVGVSDKTVSKWETGRSMPD